MHKVAIIILASCILMIFSCTQQKRKHPRYDPLTTPGSYELKFRDCPECSTYGKIAGKVIDKSTKKRVCFCSISIQGTNLGTVSDINGDYYIIKIPPGIYNIHAREVCYKKVIAESIKVEIGKMPILNFELVRDPEYKDPSLNIKVFYPKY